MRFKNTHAQLGLSPLDIKVMSLLEHASPLRSSAAAKELMGENRSSVDYRIKRLWRLGWLERSTSREYSLSLQARTLFDTGGATTKVELFADLKSVQRSIIAELEGPRKNRLFFIEPASARLILKDQTYDFTEMQNWLIESGRVAEGVVSETLSAALSYQQRELLRKRLFECYVVADELIAFDDSIWITDTKTYLINPRTEQYRLIHDKSFADSMALLAQSLAQHGARISFNK